MKIKYFKSASEFRRWLEVNHARLSEIRVGFFKKDSGRRGLTCAEAVDEALCFGWIDGLKKRVDELRREGGNGWAATALRLGMIVGR